MIDVHTHTNTYTTHKHLGLLCFHLLGIQTLFPNSTIHTNQTVWGVLCLSASLTSMTPGPMPSTLSLAALEHSGSPPACPGQVSDCLPWARPCASNPLRSITKPDHRHCLPALKPEPGESPDRAGTARVWWAPLQTRWHQESVSFCYWHWTGNCWMRSTFVYTLLYH